MGLLRSPYRYIPLKVVTFLTNTNKLQNNKRVDPITCIPCLYHGRTYENCAHGKAAPNTTHALSNSKRAHAQPFGNLVKESKVPILSPFKERRRGYCVIHNHISTKIYFLNSRKKNSLRCRLGIFSAGRK